VADGDAPPERFDHFGTLTDQSVRGDTPPNFLRKKRIWPLLEQWSNTSRRTSLHPASNPDERLGGATMLRIVRIVEGVVLGFLDILKLRSRLEVIHA